MGRLRANLRAVLERVTVADVAAGGCPGRARPHRDEGAWRPAPGIASVTSVPQVLERAYR